MTHAGSSLSASADETLERIDATSSCRACAFASRRKDSVDEMSESDLPCNWTDQSAARQEREGSGRTVPVGDSMTVTSPLASAPYRCVMRSC